MLHCSNSVCNKQTKHMLLGPRSGVLRNGGVEKGDTSCYTTALVLLTNDLMAKRSPSATNNTRGPALEPLYTLALGDLNSNPSSKVMFRRASTRLSLPRFGIIHASNPPLRSSYATLSHEERLELQQWYKSFELGKNSINKAHGRFAKYKPQNNSSMRLELNLL